jgi:hypothetical protein
MARISHNLFVIRGCDKAPFSASSKSRLSSKGNSLRNVSMISSVRSLGFFPFSSKCSPKAAFGSVFTPPPPAAPTTVLEMLSNNEVRKICLFILGSSNRNFLFYILKVTVSTWFQECCNVDFVKDFIENIDSA